MRMKKYLWWFTLCLLPLGLAGCGDGDSEMPKNSDGTNVEDGSSSNNDPEELPKLADIGIVNPVIAMTNLSFTYNDGRLTEVFSAPRDYYLFGSHPLSIKYSYESKDGPFNTVYQNIKRNEDGFITYVERINSGRSQGHYHESFASATLTYDEEGHLVKEEGRSGDTEWVIEYEWSDGNMVKVRYRDEVYRFDYGENEYLNPGIFIQFSLVNAQTIFDQELYYYSGLLGRPSKNIPIGYYDYYTSHDFISHVLNLSYDPLEAHLDLVDKKLSGSTKGYHHHYYFEGSPTIYSKE